jgi:hypothetical protein
VYGDSGQSCLVGVVVVNPAEVPAFLGTESLSPGELERACAPDALREAILGDMMRIAKEKGFFGFQQVKAITLDWPHGQSITSSSHSIPAGRWSLIITRTRSRRCIGRSRESKPKKSATLFLPYVNHSIADFCTTFIR